MRPGKLPAALSIVALLAGGFTVGATVLDEGTPAAAAVSSSIDEPTTDQPENSNEPAAPEVTPTASPDETLAPEVAPEVVPAPETVPTDNVVPEDTSGTVDVGKIAQKAAPTVCNVAPNGSFEEPNIQGNPNFAPTPGATAYASFLTNQATISGWSVVSGTVDILRWYSNASEGAQSIDMFGVSPGVLEQTFTGLVPGAEYTFGLDYSGRDTVASAGTVSLANGGALTPVQTLTPVANAAAGGMPPTQTSSTVTWAPFTHTFTAAATSATVRIANAATPGPGGTGLFIDNFNFDGPCTDFGDAPRIYDTQTVDDGPRHLIDAYDAPAGTGNLMLGSTIDNEADGPYAGGAIADDMTDAGDEDGVSAPIDYEPNTPETVDVAYTNDTGAAATLAAWIDLDRNGAFDAGERQVVPVPTGTGTVDVTFPALAGSGNTYSRFRLFLGTVADPSPSGLVLGGEVEDHRVFGPPTVLTCEGVPNGSFEEPQVDGHPDAMQSPPGVASYLTNQSTMTGWNVIAGTVDILRWFSNPSDGVQSIDMWGVSPATIEQSFTGLVPGESYTFSLDYSGLSTTLSTGTVSLDTGTGLVDLETLAPAVDGTPGGTPPTSPSYNVTWSTFTHTFVATSTDATIRITNQDPPGPINTGLFVDNFQMTAPGCDLLDFGDAPDSYDTTLTPDGPRHAMPGYDESAGTASAMLGSSIDEEDDGQPNTAATGDGADEDGVTFNPALGYPSPTLRTGVDPTSQQPISNTLEVDASADGFVSVWVDWNQDGDFLDAGEQVANAHAVTAGSNDVTFSQGTNPAGIQTYVRVRYSTDAASVATPTGAAPDGEVEDYRVLVERLIQPDTCTVSNTDYYAFTFSQPAAADLTGTGNVGSTARYRNVTVVDGVAVDMFVEVIAGKMRSAGSGGAPPNGFWTFAPDDAAWQIDPAATLRYSFYEAGTTTPIEVNAVFTVGDLDSPESATFSAGDLAGYAVTSGSTVTIVESGANIIFDGTSDGNLEVTQRFQVVFEETSTFQAQWAGFNGSGFGFDGDGDTGIQPPACQDFGDAPDSYGTSIGANGANHTIVPGLLIGSEIDFDPAGQPSPGADGDNSNRVADEDGVADAIVLTVGNQTTVSVSATNSTTAAATLAGWIDLDGSGTFDAGELVTVAVPAGSGTANYELVFPVGSVTADTFARFRLFPGDVTSFSPTGPATAGEVEDYPVTVVVPGLEIEKTSSATEDSRPGDTVTYTVTATNSGTGDYTAANPAVVLDDLSGVLDDGTFNGIAQADRGMTPSYASPIISWVGELPARESVTIEYEVLLVAGGDGVVRNVAFAPGCDPADADCVVVTPECDPPTGEGTDPATGLPCAEAELLLPRLLHTKVANTPELPVDGGEVEYTITVTNTGPGVFTVAKPGTLTDDLSRVLDDGSVSAGPSVDVGTVTFDAADESIEWSGALGVGEVATITYTVTYDASTGDNQLLNVACIPLELAQDPADPCRSVQIPGSELQDRKSVNPASGTSVVAGQAVAYTLYFQNTGQADATVDTFDDVSDVLDDATLTTGPTTSNAALQAVLNGDQIDIVGTVPPGETYTVTYTVTVNPFAQQNDHVLGNVLGADCAANDPTCRTENPVRHITVTKTSDAAADVNAGDTVEYTVTVSSDGKGDYTDLVPAVAQDDLTDVLDDATYNGDASAPSGTVSYATPMLTWTGALASGDTVTFSYTVTVTNLGNHVLENVAGPVCADPEICDPPAVVTTLLPHVVPAKSSNTTSGEGVNAGDVVTYTLTWTNDGQAAGTVDATDDLSDVLDDGDVTAEPSSTNAAITVVRTGDKIRVTGPILVNETVTVTYEVTIKPDGARGDNIAKNVLTPDVPPYVCEEGDSACVEFPPPTTEHPVGELDDWKTVDPASGSTVQPGQNVTYTLHFENTGKADVSVNEDDVLTRIVDDATITTMPAASAPALVVSGLNGDRFAVTGTLAPGQMVTVTYTVTVNPDGQRGDDLLGNFLVDTGEEPPTECAPTDEQRPDCTINHVSNVVPSKSANPASGSNVTEGQTVTYTLTFENVSANPQAADAPIDYTDHMVDVIDDATITSGPVASDPAVTAVVQGDTIRVTGAVASGSTVTVTYTVTVKAYDKQANHHLGNVIAATGDEPICVAGSNLCTSNELPAPPPGLASTGGTIAWGAVYGALVLLLIGGGAVLINRRRRGDRAQLS